MARDVRLKAHRAGKRGIPPRLPAEQVEVLPFFGRTWYVHGVDYWFRRVVAVLLAAVGMAVATVAEISMLNIASGIGSAAGRWVWRVCWAALLVAGLVRPTRDLLDTRRARLAGSLTGPDRRPPVRRCGVLGALVRIRDLGGRVFFVLGVLLYFGWFVYFLILTLQPEYGQEQFARARLQLHHRVAQLAGHPDDPLS